MTPSSHTPDEHPSTTDNRGPAWLGLLIFFSAVLTVAVLGAVAASSSTETYRQLDLPAFAPPSWLFGPVWSVLYVMIAVSGWLAWRAGAGALSLTAWAIQLLLNLGWTPLFFAWDRPVAALIDIVALLLVVLTTIALFHRSSPLSAWLLAPYAAWVAFATALNASIVLLN